MKLLLTFLLTISIFSSSSKLEAKLLHIIHTNDLHSYFEGVGDGASGYAQVKTIIDQLKKDSADKGIETLVLDGGDWGEGSTYFYSDEGVDSIKALGMLGIEYAVLGNHDYMYGGKKLSEQIIKANTSTKFLTANMKLKGSQNLDGLIEPMAYTYKAGKKIAIIGLTTNEFHYRTFIDPGKVTPAIKAGKKFSRYAKKKREADVVIALTHLGVEKDKKLARKSKYIDIIVGGHSHTSLKEVVWQKNKKDQKVPIVQSGAHGMYVGSLMVDINNENKVKVVDYKLVKIQKETKKDEAVSKLVEEAFEKRNQTLLGGDWDKVVGTTDITLTGYENGEGTHKVDCWGQQLAKLTTNESKADIGFFFNQFFGKQIKPGPVTMGNLVDNFPHALKMGDQGYQIVTSKVRGAILKTALKIIMKDYGENGIAIFGAKIKETPKGKRKVVLLNGEKIKSGKLYKIAFLEVFVQVVDYYFPKLRKILLKKTTKTGSYYWPLLIDYVSSRDTISCQF